MRWFLDTQLYSYLANGTIKRAEWEAVLTRRELCLSPITAYELLEGALNCSTHTYANSQAALHEARLSMERVIEQEMIEAGRVASWITSRPERLSRTFFQFRESIECGRAQFLAQIRAFMTAVMPNYRAVGDPLFAAEWQATVGRAPGEHLDAAFVFQTSVLERAMRIRYNPDKHPSDYLDYLQLRLLNDETLAFVTADRRLVRAVTRSMQSDRIYLWEELAGP